ncbi:hypothetical protein ONA91_27225 [Micromonospora sp. DR5-3]|uniref:hypothetical protein n=1 Tax=unclassified Micromonospora TaxID=2617518 RepID=UPI0011D714A1|nr:MULTISPECIES: hypothetical protein [unclassified Micromonospora]MCW3818147.1 hypothetical protein [Micromonospora sp. DR5-3]TYC21344.1 hypothetical protein FXF52_26250 [Micromonospora sp. MP36]
MISDDVSVARPCDDCGAELTGELTQRIVGDRLHWADECHCPHCGAAWVTCGWDDTPAEIREALIAQRGLARLTVEGTPTHSRVALLKVFREAGASLPEATAAAQRAVTTGIEGTRTELALLAQRLQTKNISAIIDGDCC